MSHSKIGKAMYIRVSPKNCMAICDALKLAGLQPSDFTFSSATARVLDMLLAGLIRDGVIPERDGFEFLNMMGEFVQQNRAQLPSVSYRQPTPREDAPISPVVLNTATTHEQRLANVRFKELMVKREHAPDSWTEEDTRELEIVQDQMG
ncbi:MAG: hypothetical protein ACHQWH_04205 [Nitrososphaerales archaeon]